MSVACKLVRGSVAFKHGQLLKAGCLSQALPRQHGQEVLSCRHRFGVAEQQGRVLHACVTIQPKQIHRLNAITIARQIKFQFRTCLQLGGGMLGSQCEWRTQPRGSSDDLIFRRSPLRIPSTRRDGPALGLHQAPGGSFLYYIRGLFSLPRGNYSGTAQPHCCPNRAVTAVMWPSSVTR